MTDDDKRLDELLSRIEPLQRSIVIEPIEKPRMTDAQRCALQRLCRGYKVEFREDDYHPQFDLPPGYVAGWIGGRQGLPNRETTIYVGVSPEGEVSS